MKSIQKQKDSYLAAYDSYSDGLFRYAFFKTSNREVALDLVQDTFTAVWEYIVNGKEINSLKSFLYKTLNNKIIDFYRKKQSESLDALVEEGYDIGFDEKSRNEDIMMGEEVWLKVQSLDKQHAEILTLRYINDLSIKEISSILDQSENNISVRIHRALEKLKGELGKN